MDISRKNYQPEKTEGADHFFPKSEEHFKENKPDENSFLEKHGSKVLAHWRAQDFEVYEEDKKWHIYIYLVIIAITGYAVWSNSLVMAITFILIGVVIYLQLNKDPKIVDFAITTDGVVIGKEIFEYTNIKSFWIHNDPPHEKYLSLHTHGNLLPIVHISVDSQDPHELREILLNYIPEVKNDLGFIDVLERFLRM
jgi:hypothetical protein